MSCTVCEDQPLETYVRVGRANVMIVGCNEHLKELIRLLRLGTETDADRISLCESCYSMTKTIEGKCGKCKAEKDE